MNSTLQVEKETMRRSVLNVAWLWVVVTIAAMGAQAADRTLAETLAKMDEVGSKFKGMAADIVHVNHMDQIHEDTTESGTILLKRPKPKELHVRVDYQKPDQKVVVSDGNRVETYYPRTGLTDPPIQISSQKSLLTMVLVLGFGGSSKELLSAYEVKLGGQETVAGEAATRLELVPKSADMLNNLLRVDLWISNKSGETVQQKLFEKAKDFDLITYTNIKLNPEIPDSDFKLPKGNKRETTGKR